MKWVCTSIRPGRPRPSQNRRTGAMSATVSMSVSMSVTAVVLLVIGCRRAAEEAAAPGANLPAPRDAGPPATVSGLIGQADLAAHHLAGGVARQRVGGDAPAHRMLERGQPVLQMRDEIVLGDRLAGLGHHDRDRHLPVLLVVVAEHHR